ncbi:MAG: hypothetical protein IJI98_08190 [Methanosphaera sp.]|nr:hypothetical protein [Methanosphaera sp.]
MANKTIKISLLGLLLIMFMSVAMAAEVTQDTTNEVTTPSIDTIEATTPEVVDVESDVTDTDCGCTCPINPSNTSTVTPDTTLTVQNDTTYDFSGTFTNKNYNFENLDTVVFTSSANNAIFYNTTFTLSGKNIKISNLIFNNTNTNGNPITITSTNVSCISGNTINVFKNVSEETFGINVINSNNTCICGNTINEIGVPQMMGWETGVGAIKFSGIVFNNVNTSCIKGNTLNLQNVTTAYPFGYSTMEAITVKGGSQNDTVKQNVITVTGSEYIYAISLSEFDNNITVEENNITLTGSNYICGVQLSSVTNSTVRKNKIEGTCSEESGQGASYEAFAYGVAVLTGTWGASTSEATGNIVEYNNVTLDSTVAYAYELSNADNTIIQYNNASITGNVVMALGIYNSSCNNITNNIFRVTGNTRTLNNSIYEAVYPETTGIKIVDYSSDIIIDNNSITVTDTTNNNSTYCVIIEEDCDSIDVINNTLYSSDPLIRQGNDSVYDDTLGGQNINNNN